MESPFNLTGKVAFVTGSTRGIGWACAKVLAQYGATVLVNGVSSAERLTECVGELKDKYGVSSDGYLFDVSDIEAVKKCYHLIFDKYKRLDILVNNAGVLEDGLIGMISQKSIDKIFNINVKGVIYNIQYASRLMIRNNYGSIINISSIIGRLGKEGEVVYGGSKAAVIGVTLSASKELAPQNIRVNAVAPGFIETDLVKNLKSEKYEEWLKNIKMKKIGKPEDVAKAVLFFASDLSSYITGQVLGIDGGMVI